MIERRDDGAWWWVPHEQCFLDGIAVTVPCELRAGQVLDLAPVDAPVRSWLVKTGDINGDFTSPFAPVAAAANVGAFSFDDSPTGWVARFDCRADPLGLDSLSSLERIMRSPLEARLSRLTLTVWHPDATIDWAPYVEAHRRLARFATFELHLVEAPPVLPSHHAPPTVRPHAVFPLEGWKVVPLTFEAGHWVLRKNSQLLRFLATAAGLNELDSRGQPREPVAWFKPVPLSRERWPQTLNGFMLVPGPSEFMNGTLRLPAGPLSPASIAVFADTLVEHGDAAGPLLAAAATGSHEAVDLLHEPYLRTCGASRRLVFEGTHCCGFFEEVSIVPWLDFHLDLDAILRHPMLQRLRVLRLKRHRPDEATDAIGSADLGMVVDTVHKLAPAVEVLVDGTKLGRGADRI